VSANGHRTGKRKATHRTTTGNNITGENVQAAGGERARRVLPFITRTTGIRRMVVRLFGKE